MKRLILFVAILLTTISPLAAEGKKKAVADFLRSISPTFDVLPNAGPGTPKISGKVLPPEIHVSGTDFVINNTTAYWASWIFAYGEVLKEKDATHKMVPVKIEPWGSVAGTVKYEPVPGRPIPILIKFFRDEGLTDYVGPAIGSFISYGNGSSISLGWTIDSSMIRTPSGERLPDLLPSTVGGTKKIKIPKEWLDGKSGVQLINNIPNSVAVVRRNGRNCAIVGFRDVYFGTTRGDLGAYGNSLFEVIFQDPYGAPIGRIEFSTPIIGQGGGILSKQLIVNLDDLRQ